MMPSPSDPTTPLTVTEQGNLTFAAIDPVVNLWTAEDFGVFPEHLRDFWERIRLEDKGHHGIEVEEMLDRMDAANIEIAFLLAARGGEWEITYQRVYDVCERYPDRFRPIAGIDPNRGLAGVKELEIAVTHYGFLGAHLYPHWFGLAPNHALYYPYYSKCAELEVPIQIQVGHSAQRRMPTVARPMTLDEVAIAMPELRLLAIHTGWPYIEEAISIAWKHEHVYIGTDAHAPRYWDKNFVQFINTRGRKKVVFGTDWPIIDFGRARRELDQIEIRQASLPWLLRENCRRLYELWDLPPTPGTEGE